MESGEYLTSHFANVFVSVVYKIIVYKIVLNWSDHERQYFNWSHERQYFIICAHLMQIEPNIIEYSWLGTLAIIYASICSGIVGT